MSSCGANSQYSTTLPTCEKFIEENVEWQSGYYEKAANAALACEAPVVTEETCAGVGAFCTSKEYEIRGVKTQWPTGCGTPATIYCPTEDFTIDDDPFVWDSWCAAFEFAGPYTGAGGVALRDQIKQYPSNYYPETTCGEDAVLKVEVTRTGTGAAPFAAVSAAAVAALAALALVF